MPSFANSALRILGRILGADSQQKVRHEGIETALDGNTAVALAEAVIGEAAGLGGSFPADTASLVWRAEQARLGAERLGGALSGRHAEGPRGALASAMGLSMSGLRATAFLSGPDLATAQDLLVSAAGRHLPLVLHLCNRALGSHSSALGSGHEAHHFNADTGFFMLFAANVQEAVDFTLVARRTAELTLIPCMVVMDAEQTALAAQEVRLPTLDLARRFLGSPAETISTPTASQQLLFGDQRRRVPRWHDLDRPVLSGGLESPSSWELGKAADRAFFTRHLGECLDDSFKLYEKLTGRQHRSVSSHRLDSARILLVAQGSAVETLEAVADQVRAKHKIKVGVLGVRSLRPFPGAEIAKHLKKGRTICVLERLDTPLAGDPPLLREVRAALHRALENGRFGENTHPGYPVAGEADWPRFLSVVCGLGGYPLRGADLVRLCSDAEKIKGSQVYLGIEFAQASSDYPKRQVLLDRLRRSYPGIANLGLSGDAVSPDLRPDGAITLAVHRRTGGSGEGLSLEAATFLRKMLGGSLRARPALISDPWGTLCSDVFSCAPSGLRDPGDDLPVDLHVLCAGTLSPDASTGILGISGLALVEGTLAGELPDKSLLSALAGNNGQLRLYGIPGLESKSDDQQVSAEQRIDYLVGALCAVLLDAGKIDTSARRLMSLREETLQQLPARTREPYIQAFTAGFEGIQVIEPEAAVQVRGAPSEAEAPLVVRRPGVVDDAYDSLPRFWDHVGVLYRNGVSGQLAPDPYLALGIVPPLSSAFRNLSPMRTMLPVFDPEVCTGCGSCWSHCPDTAIGAKVASAGRVIDSAIGSAGADALRPLASKLAARINSLCKNPSTAPKAIDKLVTEAFGWLKGKANMPEERMREVQSAVNKIAKTLGAVPTAVTETFFSTAESAEKGSGELLFLAVNPDACKGCGICVSSCPDQALTSSIQDSGSLAQSRRTWKLLERLPDTADATIDRVGSVEGFGTLPALMLSRRFSDEMVGGDGAEPGSGERLALRLALGITACLQAPRMARFLDEVRTNRDKITDLIRQILASALPSDDLDILAKGLDAADSQQSDLISFITEAENAVDSGIDTGRLRRLVQLARDLGDLAWQLTEGRQGSGRSSLGMVYSSGPRPDWAGTFPNNPFREPVVLDPTGEGAQLAAGLVEGQLRQVIEGFILVRKARLELESPSDAVRNWSSLDQLGWKDLADEERALCPPLLVVGHASILGGRGLPGVSRLLSSDLPVKILLTAEHDLGLSARAGVDTPIAAYQDPLVNLGLLTLAHREACIAQVSLGSSDHFQRAMDKALRYRGPALINVHTPSPARHGFACDQTLQQAARALAARVHPLFVYDPDADGVFGSRLSLEGNPAQRADWVDEEIADAATPAHWALTEGRFAALFSPLPEDADNPLALKEYLALGPGERGNKTPYVALATSEDEQVRYLVDPLLVRATEERLHGWRTLQELAGQVTPFTAQVEQEAQAKVAAAHESELGTLRAEYEARIRNMQDEMRDLTRNEIRERLLSLAGYGAENQEQKTEINAG